MACSALLLLQKGCVVYLGGFLTNKSFEKDTGESDKCQLNDTQAGSRGGTTHTTVTRFDKLVQISTKYVKFEVQNSGVHA